MVCSMPLAGQAFLWCRVDQAALTWLERGDQTAPMAIPYAYFVPSNPVWLPARRGTARSAHLTALKDWRPRFRLSAWFQLIAAAQSLSGHSDALGFEGASEVPLHKSARRSAPPGRQRR